MTKILLIDDERANLGNAQPFFWEPTDMRRSPRKTVSKALNYSRSNGRKIVMTDIKMPGMGRHRCAQANQSPGAHNPK